MLVKIFMIGMTAFALSTAAADDAPIDTTVTERHLNKMIKKGNWTIAGDASANYNSQSGLEWSVRPSAEYFVADNFSVGGTFMYLHDKWSSTYGLGVAATYYFAEGENGVWFVRQALMYAHSEFDAVAVSQKADDLLSSTTLGYNYFLTPSVAIGPRVNVRTSQNYPYTNFSLLFGIQVYF